MSYTREQVLDAANKFAIAGCHNGAAMLRQLLAECDKAQQDLSAERDENALSEAHYREQLSKRERAEQQLAQYVDALESSVEESNVLSEKLSAAVASADKSEAELARTNERLRVHQRQNTLDAQEIRSLAEQIIGQQAELERVRGLMRDVTATLDKILGDTDPDIGELEDADVREEYPLFWCFRKLDAALAQAAPTKETK